MQSVPPARLLQPQSLYMQLADLIREQILDGTYTSGALLPSENDMLETYKVSRVTVRQALALLDQEGMVKRIQGKGTFVAVQAVEQNFLSLHDFSKELMAKGHVPSFEILSHEWKQATAEFRGLFELKEDSALLVIERLKNSDGSPIMLERVLLPKNRIPNFPLKDIRSKWLSVILQESFNIRLARVRKSIQPIKIGRAQANLLGVSPGSLGLLVDRVTWSDQADMPPIMFTRAIVPAEHSRFYVDVDVEPGKGDH